MDAFPLAGGPQFETCSTLIFFCSHLSGLNFAQMLPYEFELVSSRLALGVCSFFVTGADCTG